MNTTDLENFLLVTASVFISFGLIFSCGYCIYQAFTGNTPTNTNIPNGLASPSNSIIEIGSYNGMPMNYREITGIYDTHFFNYQVHTDKNHFKTLLNCNMNFRLMSS
jgi:hypothetical protein